MKFKADGGSEVMNYPFGSLIWLCITTLYVAMGLSWIAQSLKLYKYEKHCRKIAFIFIALATVLLPFAITEIFIK